MIQMVMPSLPIIVMPPQGASVLPLVELDKTKVKTKRRRVQIRDGTTKRKVADCSYGNFTGKLSFTAWELFHAAKKTELTRSFTPKRSEPLGLLFADEHYDRFIWNKPNLRCADGSSMWLEDFSTTGLSGRIGEALAYLTMVQAAWGYVYWDRIASIWMRAARNANINHQDMVRIAQFTGQITQKGPMPQPDFAFEKLDQSVALMEAKGSFVAPGNSRPNTKRPLQHGLEQLDAWGHLITPTPARSIAIGSFLREQSDPCTDPSLILHVDPRPASHPDVEPIELPRDLIRRGNYGMWLAEMGFRDSGRALAERRATEVFPSELGVITLGGRDYAFSIQGWRIDQSRLGMPPWYPFELLMVPWRHHVRFLWDVGVTGVYAVGLDVTVLRAISASLADVNANALMDLQRTPVDLGRSQPLDGFYGSVMPDGSMLGVISTRLLEPEMRVETFRL